MIPPVPEHLRNRRDRPLDADRSTRPFRLFIDIDTMKPGPIRSLIIDLAELSNDIEIVIPSDSVTLDHSVFKACTRLSLVTDGDPSSWYTRYEGPTHWGNRAVYGGRLLAREAARVPATERDSWLASHAALTAGATYADAATTSSADAIAGRLGRSLGLMPPEAAFGLVGLWMKHHSRLVLPHSCGLLGTTADTMRWVSTRGAIPGAWAYVNACSAAVASLGSRPRDLALSVLTRVSRSLRARDEIHLALWRASGHAGGHEISYSFDVYLLLMSAAYDALARATYLVYDLGPDPSNKNWKQVHDKLQANDDLESVAEAFQEANPIRRVIAFLRNTIHEEPLADAHGSGGPAGTHIVVSEHASADFLRLAAEAGDIANFGIFSIGDIVMLRPGVFVETMTQRCLSHINRVMEASDLQHLGTTYDANPPIGTELFSERVTATSLALDGLGEFIRV